MTPSDAKRRFAQMLREAGLPRFASADLHPDRVEFHWHHGVTLCHELPDGIEDLAPLGPGERAAIVGWPLDYDGEPVHVYVPGDAVDPREHEEIPGIIVHRGPALHPDDLAVVKGIRCTSVSRTLIDCAEVMDAAELRECFSRAREMGLLDSDAMHASRARVEWRPSLPLVDELIAEFCE